MTTDDYLKGLMQNYATNAPVILTHETMIRFVNPLFNKYTYTEITFDLSAFSLRSCLHPQDSVTSRGKLSIMLKINQK